MSNNNKPNSKSLLSPPLESIQLDINDPQAGGLGQKKGP